MKKVVVIGLDGGTFDLIKPWVKEGKLPNFKRILNEGSHGILESTIPPTTAVAWPSLYTGKNPGKHGIFYFVKKPGTSAERKLVSRKEIKTDCIWDILSRYDKRSIFINCPVTYPPKKINGIMISGMLTPENGNYIYPENLKEGIEEIAEGYIIHTSQSKLPSSEEKAVEKILEEVEKRGKVTEYLYEKEDWDFFMVVFQATDKSQHKFWHKNELIYRVYEKMDEILGYFIEKSNEDISLFIVSDHGFMGTKKIVKINKFLKDEGYLKTRKVIKTFMDTAKEEKGDKKSSFFSKIGFTGEKILVILKKLRLEKLKYYTPKFIKSKIPTSNMDVDYERSICYFGGGFGGSLQAITINKKLVEDKYEKVRSEIIEELKKIKDPENGKPVIKKIYSKEDVYAGPYVDDAPDTLFLLNEGYNASEFLKGDVIENLHRITGVHHMDGIFVSYGNDIISGKEIKANIVDVMPTILYYMDVPIPEDVDGRILKEIFRGSSDILKRKKKTERIDRKKETLKQKIKELKKIGKI